MEYLHHVLGVRTAYLDEAPKAMPNFIDARYRLQKVKLDGQDAVFVYPKMAMESINTVKKHIDRIVRTEGAPAVLVLDHLTYRQKEYLLRDHIPFIVDGKQIYLPFIAVYLQDRCDGEKQETAVMLPSAQMLLLYYIYHGCGELLTIDAAQGLELTPTSISRASKQLEELGVVHTEKRGVQKVIYSDQTPEKLFHVSMELMRSPVKRTVYVPKSEIKEKLQLSGYSALAEYTMMNPSSVDYRAADSVAEWEKVSSARMHNSEDQCAVELWRYDPRKLSADNCVDRLSLALALSDDRDERVEEAIEEMLEQVWRDIDGKRN